MDVLKPPVRWTRAYWDEEDIRFFFETDEDGWVLRPVELCSSEWVEHSFRSRYKRAVAVPWRPRYAWEMGTAARRDDLLEQIRALPLEDRDYIEAALMREAYESGRRTESSEELDEIKQRAADALSGRNPSYSREESIARARAAVEAVRSRKP